MLNKVRGKKPFLTYLFFSKCSFAGQATVMTITASLVFFLLSNNPAATKLQYPLINVEKLLIYHAN